MHTLKFKNNADLRKLAQQTLKRKKFKLPYTSETTSKKGVYLVKDDGIYLMNAFWLGEGTTPNAQGFVIYAEGYDPSTNKNVWQDSRDAVGGDDFGEFVEMSSLMLASIQNGSDVTLMISAETIELKVVA
tara:strand:- start:1242 stop:1631 length:390 start_codon:yes stop_codon:yes gene_type:complete